MPGPHTALDVELAVVASRQHGLLTHRQVLEHGGTRRFVQSRLASGRWQSWEHGVYLVGGAPATWPARLHAACLATDGLASHRSGCVLWLLDGFAPGVPEVTVASERWCRRPGIRVHASDVEEVDRHQIDGIPVTGIDRLLLDLGGCVGHGVVRQAVFEALNRRLTTWVRIADVYERVGGRGRRGSAALRAVLDDHYGSTPSESRLEDRAEELLVAAGLPRPERQVRIDDDHGFVARVDLAYPAARIAIELDSLRWHLTPEAFERDRRKRNRLRLAGWLVIELTDRMLREQPDVVVAQVTHALRVRDVRAS